MKINVNDIGAGSGLRLQQIRNMLNLTKRQMAARLDLLPGTYYKNETGESRPGWKTMFILQHDYNISMDWLIFNKGPMYIKDKINVKEMETQRKQEKEDAAVLNKKLEQAEKELKDFNLMKKQLPELEKMIKMMADDPELRYDMLRNFHRYMKNSNPKTDE